jgi:hypothetical protein
MAEGWAQKNPDNKGWTFCVFCKLFSKRDQTGSWTKNGLD